ncbi:MAG: hypothetical protein SOH95_02465 [Bifidobacterium crudilactis]|jgi:hypothetical protein
MMMKSYELNGRTFLFGEGRQPKGAVEVPKRVPENKDASKTVKRKTSTVNQGK